MANDKGDEDKVPLGRQRVDKWLFFARIVKSRSLAQKLVRDRNVKINGSRVIRASVEVGFDDKVMVVLGRRVMHLVVKAPGLRRGPFSEAALLYNDISPPPQEPARLKSLEQAQRAPGAGRPTKRERRSLMHFRGDN